jgi:hypothetical protein
MANLPRSRASADRLIKRWGGKGFIIRNGVKRPAYMARLDYTPRERGLFQDGAERMFVSGLTAVGPDHEQDELEFNGKTYKIVEPVKGPRPDGLIIFYDCSIMLTSPSA